MLVGVQCGYEEQIPVCALMQMLVSLFLFHQVSKKKKHEL